MNGFISFKKVKSSFSVVRPFAWNRKPVNGIIPLQRHLVYFSTDTRILDFGATIVFLSLMNIRAISCHYYNLYYTCILVNKTLKYNRYVDQGWTDNGGCPCPSNSDVDIVIDFGFFSFSSKSKTLTVSIPSQNFATIP